MSKPCLGCGELTDASRCPSCHTASETARNRGRGYRAKDAEYDSTRRRLSARARRMQGYCSVCGTTQDLTTDHKPSAWQRKAQGKPIRLEDVDVLCRVHNSRAGSSKPGSQRAAACT